MTDLNALQKQLGYKFQNKALLKNALTHRSVEQTNNERLEFLGDAVLSFVMADFLYNRYSDLTEGQLSRVRAGMVNGEMLTELARAHDIGTHLILGQGEVVSGGHDRDSILENAVEALIGAIYLDGGVDAVKQFIMHLYNEERLDDLKDEKLEKDPKSALQEWAQARHKPLPKYEAKTSGLAHEQTFYVTCRIEGVDKEGSGESTNRRKAEQVAAQALYKQLKQSGN
jgi:ribonuclease-3